MRIKRAGGSALRGSVSPLINHDANVDRNPAYYYALALLMNLVMRKINELNEKMNFKALDGQYCTQGVNK